MYKFKRNVDVIKIESIVKLIVIIKNFRKQKKKKKSSIYLTSNYQYE